MTAWVVGAGAATPQTIGPPRDRLEARARMSMAPSALLAAQAVRRAIDQAGWNEATRAAAACFLGVGGSGGDPDQLDRMLRASLDDGEFSAERQYQRGIRACSPLFTFQLMNNFTLCHGAILEGLGGPSGVYISRGAGTLEALREAVAVLGDGEAQVALAGGADAPSHPVCSAEMASAGRRPRDGAAVVALSRRPGPVPVQMDALDGALSGPTPDAVHLTAATTAGGAQLAREIVARRWPAPVIDSDGDGMAAGPALGWVAAWGLVGPHCARVAALSIDAEGRLTQVHLVHRT